MTARRWLLLALVAASAAGCDAGADPPSTDTHVPANDDEHLLAERYRGFVRALERNDADAICRQLDEKLAEFYRCRSRLRIPRDLQGIEVPLTEVFAVRDPGVPLEIQISARSRRADGGRLILFFRRSGDDWRIKETMVGFYG